jgi:hypothetical protein
MRRLAAFAFVIALSGIADACECAFSPLSTESVRSAKSVFVFRLLSSELQAKGSDLPISAVVVGKIQVVDVIRGTSKAKTILYSTHQCCGTRLDVGKYYAAFVQADEAQLLGNSGNLIELGEMYYPTRGSRAKIEAMLAGRKSLEKSFSEYSLDRTQQVPRPPAPYCPNDQKRGK